MLSIGAVEIGDRLLEDAYREGREQRDELHRRRRTDGSGGKAGMPGVGKGRRMPVQQPVDVAVPLETASNQWTQFEDWPEFMHRVTRVTQDDDCTVKFAGSRTPAS